MFAAYMCYEVLLDVVRCHCNVGSCWLLLMLQEVGRCSLKLLDVVACWMFLDAVGCPELLDTV